MGCKRTKESSDKKQRAFLPEEKVFPSWRIDIKCLGNSCLYLYYSFTQLRVPGTMLYVISFVTQATEVPYTNQGCGPASEKVHSNFHRGQQQSPSLRKKEVGKGSLFVYLTAFLIEECATQSQLIRTEKGKSVSHDSLGLCDIFSLSGFVNQLSMNGSVSLCEL
ncbi:hypothetical protein Anapl_12341 [Anas platyrhynchos]|uniref:Uncharacterized protein n=1 Tax=Anas platyrhynchos TaxID=8839 RepID=R0LS67_ANAPL|nr:hypothetical protein Anapl_12341 [Anas platyrhynchos]